jgi:diguanylate cyclase (GGDEF)-like protein
MVIDRKLTDEAGRVAALHRYEVMDTAPEAPFDRITKLVQMVLQVPVALVSLIENDRQQFKSCIGVEYGDTRRDESFCTHTIMSREAMNIPDATKDERFAENRWVTSGPGIRSYLGAPLMTPDGYNVGALCAIDMKPRDFSPEQVQMMTSFASLVVDELELRRISHTDHLTKAATRRGFMLEMEKQIARMKRSKRESSVILLDVDHFKKVNDTYGHPAGDAVLRNLAERIKGILRTGDLLGRIGGEEFGVLLPDADAKSAGMSAERIRRVVAETPLVKDPELSVTISLGVCALAEVASPEEWLAQADAGLYDAKRAGRNRVVVVGDGGRNADSSAPLRNDKGRWVVTQSEIVK